jgi:hypothetical protein
MARGGSQRGPSCAGALARVELLDYRPVCAVGRRGTGRGGS